MILIDSVFRTGNYYYYYSKVFLDECKYIDKEEKIHNYIIDNV